jgi:hypothetical protein
MFGCDTLSLTAGDITRLEVLQGNLINQSLGKRCCIPSLLKALNGTIYPKTLIGHIVKSGLSPIEVAFTNDRKGIHREPTTPDGVVNSLRHLLFSPNYNYLNYP